MKRKTKRKKKLKIWRFLFLLAIISASIFLVYKTLQIKVQLVLIKNNNLVSDRNIIDQGNLRNFKYFNDTSKIKKQLLKNPLIDSVEINRAFLFTLELDIKEKEIILYDELTYQYILNDGSKIKLDIKDRFPVLKNSVIKKIYDPFIEEFSKINKTVRTKISEIIYLPTELDEGLFKAYMNDGNTLTFNPDNLDKANYYDIIVNNLQNKKGIISLDSATPYSCIFKLYNN